MNRKQRRAQAALLQKDNRLEDKKKELVERYGRLATQAGDLNYRVYVLNKEMEDIQRQHAAIVDKEEKEQKDAKPIQAETPAPAADPS